MILGKVRLLVLGAGLAGLAAPPLAAAPSGASPAEQAAAAAGTQRADADRARRVELPFPIGPRAPALAPPSREQQEDEGPHPFREIPLKRAALTGGGPDALRDGRLSPPPDLV